MAAINQVGNALTGVTGTGSFVGSNSPTITTPIIGQIKDSNGNAILNFVPVSSAVNYIAISNAAVSNVPEIVAQGTDTNISVIIRAKGTGGVVFFSQNTSAPFSILSGTASQHTTSFVFSNTAATRSVVFPDRDFVVGDQLQCAQVWVRFTTVTTTSILGSYNVTSLTDNGTGDTTINFTTSFSSVNYCSTSMIGNPTTGLAVTLIVSDTASSKTASALRVKALQGAGFALVDANDQNVSCFGVQ
jgi:hypothetical protein